LGSEKGQDGRKSVAQRSFSGWMSCPVAWPSSAAIFAGSLLFWSASTPGFALRIVFLISVSHPFWYRRFNASRQADEAAARILLFLLFLKVASHQLDGRNAIMLWKRLSPSVGKPNVLLGAPIHRISALQKRFHNLHGRGEKKKIRFWTIFGAEEPADREKKHGGGFTPAEKGVIVPNFHVPASWLGRVGPRE